MEARWHGIAPSFPTGATILSARSAGNAAAHYGGLFDPASDSTPNDLCLSPPGQFGTPSTYASSARKPRSPIDFERDQGDARRRLDLGPGCLRQCRCNRHLFRHDGRLGDRRDCGTRASRVCVARVRHRGFRDRISLSIFGRRMDGSGRHDRPTIRRPGRASEAMGARFCRRQWDRYALSAQGP